MKVIVAENHEEVSRLAADILEETVRANPCCTLGLATGSSPVGMYRELSRRCREEGLDFSRVHSVNLDEYVGLAPTHEQSYRYFMDSNLFDHINIDKANTYVAKGTGDAEENLRRLDMTFRQPWRVVMLLQRDKAWEMDVPEKVCARLSRSHDIYGFSYAERSVFVMLVGMDSQDRQPLVRELEQLAQEPEFADSQPRFSLGIPFEKLTQAPQSYMDALSAGRRMTGEGVAVYEQRAGGSALLSRRRTAGAGNGSE